jgi:hypothetical protein
MAAPRYRDLQAETLVDVGARTTSSGAANAAQALADKFDSFSKTAAYAGNLSQAFAANEAGDAGTKAGLAGQPEFKTGIKAMTVPGRAYNSAAEAGYVSQVQTDVNDTMTRLEQDSEADQAGFDEKAKAYADGLLATAPESMKPVLGHILTARTAMSSLKVRGQQQAKERSQVFADYTESVPATVQNTIASMQTLPPDEADKALILAVNDNKARLDELVKNNVLSPEAAAKTQNIFHAMLDKGLVAARTDGAVNELMNLATENVQYGDAALALIDQRKDLSPEDKVAIRTEYEKQRNQLQFARSRQYVEQSGALASALGSGDSGPEMEHTNLALYQRGAISVDEFQSNQATIARNAEKGKGDAADMAAVIAAWQGGRGVDVADPKMRKAADKVFSAVTGASGMTQGDPRWQAMAVQFAHSTNVLPESAESWARVNMMSGDPQQVAVGATFFARVKDANATAWDYEKDPKLAAFAEQMNANLTAGVVTERAFQMAHRNVYEQTEEQKKILAAQFTKDQVVKDNSDVLRGRLNSDEQFDPSFLRHFGLASAPAPSLEMQADYNGAVARMYSYTNGNIEQARQLAYDTIKSRYGYTMMNGTPEIVKYSPEKFYGLTPEIIRADVADTLRKIAIPSQGLKVPGNIDLTNRPVVKNADGTISTVSSMSIGTDQGEVLIPQVAEDGSRVLSSKDAIAQYERTGKHLGIFDTPENATAYAKALHNEQALAYQPDKVRLTATPDTERTKGQVWLLQAPDEYGAYDVVRGADNAPVYYELPLGQAANKAAKEKVNAAKYAEHEKAQQQNVYITEGAKSQPLEKALP